MVIIFTSIHLAVFCVLDGPKLLCKALQNILDDPSFQTKSPTAENARIGAEHIPQWSSNPDNYAVLLKFMQGLTGDLKEALVKPSGEVCQRDKVWESYFYIHSKETFFNCWTVSLSRFQKPSKLQDPKKGAKN